MAGNHLLRHAGPEALCISCTSPRSLDLPLPLTAQTSCPSRLEFRKALLTRLNLPVNSAKIHFTDSPLLIRRLCAQLIDAFRICYMSDQDLYFADSVARELQRRATQHRVEQLEVSTEEQRCTVSTQEGTTQTQLGETEATASRQQGDLEGKCLPVVLDDPCLMEEWGLLAGCESPSNLRRALFELKSRLVGMSGQNQLTLPKCRQMGCQNGDLTTTESCLGNKIPSPYFRDSLASCDVSAALQPYIHHLQHLINRFCAPANAVVKSNDEDSCADLEFSRRYHSEAEKVGVYVHPAVNVIRWGSAGRGLVASQSIPAGTPLIEVPENAILNVYAALKDPVFGHIARFLLTLQPVQSRSDCQQDSTGECEVAGEVPEKCRMDSLNSRQGHEGMGDEIPAASGKNTKASDDVELSSPHVSSHLGTESGAVPPRKLTGGGVQEPGDVPPSPCHERVSNEGIIVSSSDTCSLGMPWVDTDTVCLFYFLFEAEKGDASHFRFFFQEMIPAPRGEMQQPLIVGPPEVPEMLGDTPLIRTIEDTHLKSFNLFRQLIPLLKETFASPALSPGLGGVTDPIRQQIRQYIDSVTLQKCIWAQSVMGSRAFSVKIPPPTRLPGWALDTELTYLNEQTLRAEASKAEHLQGKEAGTNWGDDTERRKAEEVCEAYPGANSKRACIRQDEGEDSRAKDQGQKDEVPDESNGSIMTDEEETVVPFLPALRERCSNSPLYRVRLSASSSPSAEAMGPRQENNGALVCIPDHPTSFLLFTDMMNHHVHAQCAFPYFDEQTRRACVVTQADIPAGAQLYIFYGPMQSWELLAHYGFTTNSFFSFGRGRVPNTATRTTGDREGCCGEWSFTQEKEGNPYDTLTLSFEPPDDDPDEATRRLLLRLCEVPSEALLRTGAPHFSSRLLECLEISLHPDIDELVAKLPCTGFNEHTATTSTCDESLSTTADSSLSSEAGAATGSSLFLCRHQRILSEYLNQRRPGPSTRAGASQKVNGRSPGSQAEGGVCTGRREGTDKSRAPDSSDNGDGESSGDIHTIPVTQTARELLQAREEVLRKLEFWFKNEEDRPHWYDAWGQRAEFFLKNQIALFSRINELFSPDAALECSASGD